jgi:hypothetical protein
MCQTLFKTYGHMLPTFIYYLCNQHLQHPAIEKEARRPPVSAVCAVKTAEGLQLIVAFPLVAFWALQPELIRVLLHRPG